MTYINKFGLPLTNSIDIISDVFDNNLSLQKNSIPISKGIGIFNTTFSEFNTMSKDKLEIDLSNFIDNDQYLSNNITLDSTINIEHKLLHITVKVTEDGVEEQRGLIFDDIF